MLVTSRGELLIKRSLLSAVFGPSDRAKKIDQGHNDQRTEIDSKESGTWSFGSEKITENQ